MEMSTGREIQSGDLKKGDKQACSVTDLIQMSCPFTDDFKIQDISPNFFE